MILGIETSCDDTCAALVTDDGRVLSNVVASQGLLHAEYGGVVPEIASRRHLELVDAVLEDALEKAGVDLDAVDRVAVTNGPGLIGALLVGLSAAKGLAARVDRSAPWPRPAVDLYRRAFSREPTADEIDLAARFLGPEADDRAWRWLAQALLMTNEFATID